jgi:mRNA-degrading endonuclease RelE of RelBE toxin-antitoxin system
MAIAVIPTDSFIKELKRISKKHNQILSDIKKLSIALKENPTMGTDLGQNIYKIRLAISGTNKGKSGGARIITCVVLVREVIYLSEIYLKSESDTVDVDLVVQRLKNAGLI